MAERLAVERPDLKLYFPIKDVGVDLLAVPVSGRPVSIQVKESRTFDSGSTWHQVREEKLTAADVFVFISYVPSDRGGRTVFANEFVVVPQQDLRDLCKRKKAPQGKYSFYFKRNGESLVESRDGEIDFSKFLSAWRLIAPTPLASR